MIDQYQRCCGGGRYRNSFGWVIKRIQTTFRKKVCTKEGEGERRTGGVREGGREGEKLISLHFSFLLQLHFPSTRQNSSGT